MDRYLSDNASVEWRACDRLQFHTPPKLTNRRQGEVMLPLLHKWTDRGFKINNRNNCKTARALRLPLVNKIILNVIMAELPNSWNTETFGTLGISFGTSFDTDESSGTNWNVQSWLPLELKTFFKHHKWRRSLKFTSIPDSIQFVSNPNLTGQPCTIVYIIISSVSSAQNTLLKLRKRKSMYTKPKQSILLMR